MSAAYLISSLVWSVVGFVLGRVTVSVEQIRRNMDSSKLPEGAGVSDPQAPSVGEPPCKFFSLRRPSWSQLLGIVLVAMALVTMVTVFAQTYRLNVAIGCNNSAYKSYADAFNARDEAAARSREDAREWASALNTLISSFTARDPSAGLPSLEEQAKFQGYLLRFQNATGVYIDSLNHATQARAVNPLPDKRCGSF